MALKVAAIETHYRTADGSFRCERERDPACSITSTNVLQVNCLECLQGVALDWAETINGLNVDLEYMRSETERLLKERERIRREPFEQALAKLEKRIWKLFAASITEAIALGPNEVCRAMDNIDNCSAALGREREKLLRFVCGEEGKE